MRNLDKLIDLISDEAKIRLPREMWQELFFYASVRSLKRREALIDAGEYDPDVLFCCIRSDKGHVYG